MGLVRRHSIQFSAIFYTGIVLGYINTVLLFPNFLQPDEFGLTRILLSVAIVVSQFAQLSTPNMVIRYHPFFGNKILSLGLMICAIGLFIMLSCLLLLQQPILNFYVEKSPLFTRYFHLLIPFSISLVFFNLFDAYLRTLYKNLVSTFFSTIVVRLIWTALILLYHFSYLNFDQFIFLYVYAYAAIAILSLVYIKWIKQLSFSLKFESEESSKFREIRSFSIFSILSGLSVFLINKVDILMLGSFEGLEIVGIYAIASYMAAVIIVPASAIARTAQSLVANAFKNKDLGAIDSLYKKSSLHQLILSAGVYILIALNYLNLIHFLPESYHGSFAIFFYLGFSKLVDTGLGINGIILLNSKYYKIDTILSFFLLIITVITNFIFIPIFGGEGAAIATMLSLIIYNLFKYVFLRVKMKLDPFTHKTIIAVVISLISFVIPYLIPKLEHVIADGIIRSGAMLVIFVPLVYFSKISLEINEMVEKAIKFVRITK